MGAKQSKKYFIKKELINTKSNFQTKIDFVKSIYITKIIFSFLSEKTKLNIIKYNKKYQKKFGINIENYKNISGKILKINNNGIGRIFDSYENKILFEGKYINNKKNGKGKEFDEEGNIIFEGEYFKDKKIKGKGYDKKGNLILEIKGNGRGKEYYNNGNLQFEGEYLNDRKWNGKIYNYNGNEGCIIEKS